jgi:protein transport protein SEC24
MVFSSSIASIGAGAVHNRCKPEHYNNTSEEITMMSPANNYYKEIAQYCLNNRIAVDLFFAFSEKQMQLSSSNDIASIAPLAGLTGGDVILYPKFDVYKHGEKLYYQIFRNLTRVVGTEVAIRARVSTGLSIHEYIGSFMRATSQDYFVSTIDCDKTISCLIKLDDKIAEGAQVHA